MAVESGPDIRISVHNLWKLFGKDDNALLQEVGVKTASKAEIQEKTGHGVAIKDVSLEVAVGSVFVFMGLSGSGKSTCMHVLGCLDTPTAGKYLLDGEVVSEFQTDDLARIRRTKIGFVFQSFNLMAGASAQANVELPLLYSGDPRAVRSEKAKNALARVGLSDRIHHRPTQLSGGQMQRVAIARAIVNQPDIVLADEPTGALDTETGREIMDLLTELNGQGMTVIVVTHEMEVAGYAERVLKFRDGRLLAENQAVETVLSFD